MFDINPAAHNYYLADVERAYAKCRNRKAPFGNGRRWMPLRTSTRALSVMLVLVAAFSGSVLL